MPLRRPSLCTSSLSFSPPQSSPTPVACVEEAFGGARHPARPAPDGASNRTLTAGPRRRAIRPIPASAVLAVALKPERRTARPERSMVYMPEPSPEMQYFARRLAYAYITPADAACKADPAPFIHGASTPRSRARAATSSGAATAPEGGALLLAGGPGGGHGEAVLRAGQRRLGAAGALGRHQQPLRPPPRPHRAAPLPQREAEPGRHPEQLQRLRASLMSSASRSNDFVNHLLRRVRLQTPPRAFHQRPQCTPHIRKNQLTDGFPLFQIESLKYPTFAKLYDVNGKLFTAHRS